MLPVFAAKGNTAHKLKRPLDGSRIYRISHNYAVEKRERDFKMIHFW